MTHGVVQVKGPPTQPFIAPRSINTRLIANPMACLVQSFKVAQEQGTGAADGVEGIRRWLRPLMDQGSWGCSSGKGACVRRTPGSQ